MDVNEVLTEEHPFGIEPETYSELEANHPKLYKNTESGTSTVPTGNPFDGESGGVEYTLRKITFVNNRGAGTLKNAVKVEKNVLRVTAAIITGGGRTVECEILASNRSASTGKYAKQYLVFNGYDADLTFAGDYIRLAGHDDKNYIILIDTCPDKDITITIS